MSRRRHSLTPAIGTVAAIALLAPISAVSAHPADVATSPTDATTSTRPPAAPSTPPLESDTHVITLLTGDVVTVTDAGGQIPAIDVELTPGSAGVQAYTRQDDTYVVPTEALPQVASGSVDVELFNITGLIDQGYTDARGGIPLIVQYHDDPAAVTSATGSLVATDLSSIGAYAVQPDPEEIHNLWSDIAGESGPSPLSEGGVSLYLDAKVEVKTANSVPQIGAPVAWDAGLDGEGLTVAVLDTGVDLEHPDLADVIIESRSFVPGELVDDVHGHGTHVAGTVAGQGTASEGEYTGVAPGADLVVGKVLDDGGFGQLSWIIEGMEWAAEEADVVNMSLGTTEPSDGTDPLSQALDALTEDTGTLFIVASGNNARVGGINAPGAATSALTVGAVDGDDRRAWFTDMGPRPGDAAVKPDIAAPGEGIVAARSQHMAWGEGWYREDSGTSMAAPHVAGAAAILMQQYPDWSWDRVKDALMSTSVGVVDEGPYQVGAGRVDVAAVTTSPLHATGSVSFGFYDWPHEDDQPDHRTLTYTNLSEIDIALDLELVVVGEPVADSAVVLSDSTLTVPAGGQAEVDLSLTPDLIDAGTTAQGYVIATVADGDHSVRTGWGVQKESERYDLTLRAFDRDGAPILAYAMLADYVGGFPYVIEVDGETTLRLPAGDYAVMSYLDVIDEGHTAIALVGEPRVDLDRARTVDLDAREANEIVADVADDSVVSVHRRLEFDITAADFNSVNIVPLATERLLAAPTTPMAEGEFEFLTRWRLRAPYIDVLDGSVSLQPQGLGSIIPEGTIELPAVYGGYGSPAELAGIDAEGAAVVIERDRDAELSVIAQDVEAIGAELLVVVNDEPWVFVEGLWPPQGEPAAIPAAAVAGRVGADLIPRVQAGDVVLTLTGGAATDVLYDLVDPHLGAIGTDLRYAPGLEDLARIDTRFFGHRDVDAGEFRYDFRPHSQRGWGFPLVQHAPGERTDWISAQPGTEWYQDATVVENEWNERSERLAYHQGDSYAVDWFATVVHPRLGDGYWLPNRQGNYLQANLPSWAGSQPGHTAGAIDPTQTIRFYEGDTLLAESHGWQAGNAEVSGPERTQIRVTNDVSRDPDAWTTTLSSSTEWIFWTEGDDSPDWSLQELPFVQVGFDVETALDGVAVNGPDDTIGFRAYHLDGVVGAGQITDGTLAVSFDSGATWEQLELDGEPGDWTALVTYPADVEHVSLRAWAADEHGNAITQTIERAYLVDEPSGVVTRVAGANRYATAAEVARQFPGSVEHVYIASGEQAADALSGSAVGASGLVPQSSSAGTAQSAASPVLLVRSDRIPQATHDALADLDPDRITVIGGPNAVSEEVLQELAEDFEVDRVAGADRFETSAELARLYDPESVDTVYIASGADRAFADALTGAALAGSQGAPVLLTHPTRAPDAVLDVLGDLAPEHVIVLGGSSAVTDDVADALGATERIGGSNRWATAVLVAERAESTSTRYVASGLNWPDALAGSALAGSEGAAILLTRPAVLPAATEAAIIGTAPTRVTVLGGTAVVSEEVAEALEALLGP